jgi:hypothetical protein
MAMVRSHLETCTQCQREHAELASIPALLDYADSADAVPERPPARLEDAVLDRFAREHRGAAESGTGAPATAATDTDRRTDKPRERTALRERWDALRRRPGFGLAFAGAATMAMAIALAVGVIASSGGDGDGGGGTEPPIAAPDFQSELASVSAQPNAAGEATLFREKSGTVVHLKISGLKPGPDGPRQYEMWCVGKNGWRISAGTFRVDDNGNAYVQLTAAADPTKYDTLSIEPTDPSSGGGSSGDPVMVGKIRS